MAAPGFLASSFRFKLDTGVTDVATIITSFRSETVTFGSPAWTEPSAGLFKSPVDAAGRFFDVLLTSIAATNLEIRVRDQSAVVLFTRRIQIDGGGTNINYFTGQFHFHIESLRAAAECAYGGIIDQSPMNPGASSTYAYGSAFRSSADLNDGNGDAVYECFMLDNAVSTVNNRARRLDLTNGGGTVLFDWADGSKQGYPCEIRTQPATTNKWGGRLYQHLIVDSTFAFGDLVEQPIDNNAVGTFQVLRLLTINNARIACRKT